MSTALDKPFVRQAAVPISVEQYHALTNAGKLGSDVELLWGVIVKKMAKSPQHTLIVRRLYQRFEGIIPEGYHVRQEQPLTLADSVPEPDIAIVHGAAEDYPNKHPDAAALIVEVALTSIQFDRDKADTYARAGVAEYWIVNPGDDEVAIYTRPGPTAYHSRSVAHISKAGALPSQFGLIDISNIVGI
jgi:Uma2 family endonuclease